jgi:hypothetical protein
LYGISDEIRRRTRDWTLGLTPEDIRAAAKRLEVDLDRRLTVVMAGRDAIEAASESLPELLRESLDVPI